MKTETIIHGSPLTLEELLSARSRRALRQQTLLKQGGRCLISFTLNIPGAVKQFPMARQAFETGLCEIKKRLPKTTILHLETTHPNTGNEGLFLLDMEAGKVKRQMALLEENHPLGRLFDIDVLDQDGRSLSRTMLGLPPRSCLVCRGDAKICARSQAHSMELVLWHTAQILNEFFRGRAADQTAACAVRALLYEVSATPKPGLVDRNNNGSHRDMNFFTFLDSSAALIPWFRDFYCLGWDSGDFPDNPQGGRPDSLLFSRLRFAGIEAEAEMLFATGGVNTHKGLIFAFAILCGALGKTRACPERPVSLSALLAVCRRLGTCSLDDFRSPLPQETQEPAPETAGRRFYRKYGISGARGEAAAGFPSAASTGLPALKTWVSRGLSLNDAAVLTLLTLLSQVDDTNMIHRSSPETASACKEEARKMLKRLTAENFQNELDCLDRSYILANLSPGGCADLLAVSLMLYFLIEKQIVTETPEQIKSLPVCPNF